VRKRCFIIKCKQFQSDGSTHWRVTDKMKGNEMRFVFIFVKASGDVLGTGQHGRWRNELVFHLLQLYRCVSCHESGGGSHHRDLHPPGSHLISSYLISSNLISSQLQREFFRSEEVSKITFVLLFFSSFCSFYNVSLSLSLFRPSYIHTERDRQTQHNGRIRGSYRYKQTHRQTEEKNKRTKVILLTSSLRKNSRCS